MEIRKLNTLRGIAAFIVMIAHFSGSTNWLNGYLTRGAGQFGVMLFFMLSGFLMAYLYIDREYDRLNIRKYWLARAGRVLPLYFLVLVLSVSFNEIGIATLLYPISGMHEFLSHALFLKGESVLWTIGPEIQFYLIFFLIWKLASIRETYAYLLVVGIFLGVFFLGFPRPKGTIGLLSYDLAIIQCIPYFLSGFIIGKIYQIVSVAEERKSGWYVLSLVLILLMYPKIFIFLTGYMHQMWSDMMVFLVMSSVFCTILMLVPDDNPILSNGVGDFLGKISYSLYLLHMPVLWRIKDIDILNNEGKLILFVFCSVSLSYLSYRFFERPLSGYFRKFGTWRGNFGRSNLSGLDVDT